MVSLLLKFVAPLICLFVLVFDALSNPNISATLYHAITISASFLIVRLLLRLLKRERDYHGYLLIQLIIGASLAALMLFGLLSMTFILIWLDPNRESGSFESFGNKTKTPSNEDLVLFTNHTSEILVNNTKGSLPLTMNSTGYQQENDTQVLNRTQTNVPNIIAAAQNKSGNKTVSFTRDAVYRAGEYSAIQFIWLALGSRFRFDSIPVKVLSLTFAIVSFAAPYVGFSTMCSLIEPLFVALLKLAAYCTRSYWKHFAQGIDSWLTFPALMPRPPSLMFLPHGLLQYALFLAIIVLMAISSAKRFKYGRDTLLTYFISVTVRVLDYYIYRAPRIWKLSGWLKILNSSIAQFIMEACFLAIVMYIAQLMHTDVKRYYVLQFRRSRYFLVSKTRDSGEIAVVMPKSSPTTST